MSKLLLGIILLTSLAIESVAQTTAPRQFVRASGQATVYVPADQVKIDASVVTQGPSAQAAAASNATQVASVTTALTNLLGSASNVKSINYFVGPVYNYPPNGGQAAIVGYTASMTVEVTLNTITLAGSVIDTAVQAGATSIGSLQFSLQNSQPAHLQALSMATLQAKADADAMATALGRTTGAVISIQEATTTLVQPIVAGIANGGAPGVSTPTTIQPGQIEVQASMVLDVQLN